MEPSIITREDFRVVGLKYRGKNENEEIPRLWREFWPRHTEISGRVTPIVSFGVIDHFSESSSEFEYVAGIAVEAESDIPEGMAEVKIPGQTYAVFDCTLPTLMETIGHIHEEWLPNSDYKRAAGPEFELYDERFDPERNEFGMSVYIPVVKK